VPKGVFDWGPSEGRAAEEFSDGGEVGQLLESKAWPGAGRLAKRHHPVGQLVYG